MSHHEITINLENGHAVPALSSAGVLHVNDTVRYSSPAGKVRVLFDAGSPFGDANPEIVRDSEIRIFQKPGKFFCKCFITPREVGWSLGEKPESGGDHDVRPEP